MDPPTSATRLNPSYSQTSRMVSTLVDCKPDDCSIGMAVEVVIHEDEDGFKIPFFKPAA